MTQNPTPADVELKECPFCGGEAFFWEGEVAHGNFLVCCKVCECQLHLAKPLEIPEYCSDEEFDEINKTALATQWNTRTASASMESDKDCDFTVYKTDKGTYGVTPTYAPDLNRVPDVVQIWFLHKKPAPPTALEGEE